MFLDALQNAAVRRGANPKLWVTEGDEGLVPAHWFPLRHGHQSRGRSGPSPSQRPFLTDRLGIEWEWEESPEVTLTVVDSVDEAVELFNRHSPKLVASLIDDDPDSQERFYETVGRALRGQRVHPLGGRPVSRWAVPSWGFPTGRVVGCSAGERSCQGIRFSPSARG